LLNLSFPSNNFSKTFGGFKKKIIPQADGADEHDYKKARMDYLTEKIIL